MHTFDTRRPAIGDVPVPAGTDTLVPLRVPPRRVPHVGQIVQLASGDVRYRSAPMRLRVARIRSDISDCYGGEWVWVEGHELDDEGYPISWQQALIRVAALDPPPSQESTVPATSGVYGRVRR